MNFQKILIIQTASIGDVILSTPVIEFIHKNYPETIIDILVKEGNQSLFDNHPFLNQVLVWNKQEKKFFSLISIIRNIRYIRYDIVVNVQRFFSSGLITILSKAKITSGFSKNPFSLLYTYRYNHLITKDSQIHECERNLSLLKFLEIPINKLLPKLYPTLEDVNGVNKYTEKEYICIAPASVWHTKQFPIDSWVQLIIKLPKTIIVYLLGSKNDNDICEEIILKVFLSSNIDKINVVNLSGELSFLQTSTLMLKAKMNYVNDSAPMHLASAVDAPVTAIFCSTVPEFGFTPLSKRSFVIESKQNINCRPCGLHGHSKCPEKHFECAKTIDLNEIINTLYL